MLNDMLIDLALNWLGNVQPTTATRAADEMQRMIVIPEGHSR